MASRKTQQEAKATARRTVKSGSRATSSARSPKSQTPRKRDVARDPAPGRWWAVPLVAIIIVAAFGYTFYPVARVQYRETRERVRLASELEALKARNARLSKEVALLRTPEGVEDQARTQLGLVKKGEHVVVVNDGRPSQPATSADALPQIDSDYLSKEPVGPWTGFLDVVFRVQ